MYDRATTVYRPRRRTFPRGAGGTPEGFSITFRVGSRYQCTMRLPVSDLGEPVGIIGVSWSPCTPRQLSKAEMRDYRSGRDALPAKARHIGGNVAVVEV